MTTAHSSGLTQNEVYTKIRNVFKSQYRDIGVYRWLNRNKRQLKAIYAGAFILTVFWGILGSAWPITFVGLSFIALVTAGGIDHFLIGLRFRKMLRTLAKDGIVITLATLLEVCGDILPE